MRVLPVAWMSVFLASTQVQAESLNVAVASNFTEAVTEISEEFEKATGHKAILSFGATGQLYTQIIQGAPFDVLLAADDVRPEQSVTEGLGVTGSIFTYAIGQLALYSTTIDVTKGPQVLKDGNFQHLAIANPETAPYGKAAVETLQSLDLYASLKEKIVQGQNIGQAYQFIETGNAEVGFVALGQISQATAGSSWVVPNELYQPIRQDAVLLVAGQENAAAKAFLEFLRSSKASSIIQKYGYAVDR